MLHELATHPVGYNVYLAMFDRCSPGCVPALMDEVIGRVLELSRHPDGCRVVQRALGRCVSLIQGAVESELKGHVVALVESASGNYVIQKCIEELPLESSRFIVREVEAQALYLARHRYGCRVHQRILEHCRTSDIQGFTTELLRHRTSLIEDPYANFVAQHLLQFGRPETQELMVEALLVDPVKFGSNKHGSNVVEKALTAVPGAADRVTAYLLTIDDDTGMGTLAASKYGNFVIQHLLRASTYKLRLEMADRLRAMAPMLREGYGRHLMPVIENTRAARAA